MNEEQIKQQQVKAGKSRKKVQELLAGIATTTFKEEDSSMANFMTGFITSTYILQFLEKHKADEWTIFEERAVAIVRLVTSFEVFCKEIILEGTGRWNDEGLTDLLTEEITLGQAYKLFQNQMHTKEQLILHFYSFQNIPIVIHVFNKLTGGLHFLNEVGNKKIMDSDKQTLDEENPQWQSDFFEVFTIRNKIIHEGFHPKIDKGTYHRYVSAMHDFVQRAYIHLLWPRLNLLSDPNKFS